MITYEQAQYLLQLPKYILENDMCVNTKVFSQVPVNERIYMVPESADEDYLFFLDINVSPKNSLKINFHYQEDESSIGLLRIDYGGSHKNPEIVIDTVPEKFKSFAGQYIQEDHIHYCIEGYKELAWAVPLSHDEFPVKKYSTNNDLYNIIESIANLVNLKTKFNVQMSINYDDK